MIRSIALLGAVLLAGCHFRGSCDEDARDGDRHGGSIGRRDDHDRDDRAGGARCRAGDDAATAVDAAEVDAAGDAGDPTAVDSGAQAAADGGATGGCRIDRDCASAGAGLVCDARSGACVVPAQCASDAGCAEGERCLAGRCLGADAVCQFATDCAAGHDCVDGRCLATCDARSPCPSTLSCAGGYCDQPTTGGTQCARAADCAAGSACADGRCVAGCGATRACAATEACVAGFCQVDTAPRRFCARDADCATGSVCRRGACRAACPDGTSAACLRVDVTFDTCGSDLLCTNPLELRPECARTADCAAPLLCINARCR